MKTGISLLLSFGFCTAVFCQTFGQITGEVKDSAGAVIVGAKITVTNMTTNAVRETDTTDAGVYTFPSVPPAFYNLRIEHPGFKTVTSDRVEVQVQQSVRLDFTLQIGQVSQAIEVQALNDQLQTENSTVGTVVGNQEVVELPLNGREYLNLVALASNADTLSPPSGQAQSREGGDRSNQSISVGGQRIFFNYFTLDGVINVDPDFNSYAALPSIDAIQEFKVQTGVYPAEFGHQATQINVLTKSGGNQYHGTLFEFLRNDVFDALPYNFTSQPESKQPFKWNDYGGVFSGPVWIPKLFNGKNRLFFMGNYEALRQRQDFVSVFTNPTAVEFTGNFSGNPNIIYDPTTKTPFPGNIIPSSRISPFSQALLNYYVPANIPGELANNYVRLDASPFDRDAFVLRMDFVESSKSQWSGRYSWGSEVASQQGLTTDGSKLITGYEQYMGSNTRTFSPTVVNETRFGYVRLFNSTGALQAFGTDVTSQVAIPNSPVLPPVAWGIPAVSLTNYSGFGDSSDGPFAISDNTLQFVDTVSWIRGKHTFRFGFEYDRQNFDQVGNQFERGSYSFQPNVTQSPSFTGGDSFAEYLLGDIYESEGSVAIAHANFQRNMFAAFMDDTWKITPKLTLSLGLRYEFTPPFYDTLGNLVTVYLPHIDYVPNAPVSDYPQFMRQGTCTDPYAGLKIVWTQINFTCSNGTLANSLMRTEYKDFAPRLGIAYSPNSKWVVRTGYGLFYSQDIGNAVFDMARQIAGRYRYVSATGTPTVTWANAWPVPGAGGIPITSPFAFVDAYSHRTPYSLSYLLNVQRLVGNNWLLEAGYLGSVSHHLEGFQDANQPFPGVTPLSSRTPFPTFGVIQFVRDGNNSNYNSLSIKATKRFSAGLSFISSYTFSKSLDDTSGIRVQGYDELYPQNSDCIAACEYARSAFNVAHRLVTSVTYDLPIGKGRLVNITNGFLNALVGGWQTGGIWTFQSGTPESIDLGGDDRSNTGVGYDRPNAVQGVSPYPSNQSASLWFNPAAFSLQPAGTFGNLGRNVVNAPGTFALDFAVHKQFFMPFSEHHVLQFRFEAFNVLNHPVWGAPNEDIDSSGFGTINYTAINMRQIQLALKYSF